MQPEAQPVGDRDVEDAIEHPVGRIERRGMALGHQRHTEPEVVAPVGERAGAQVPRQLVLDRPIHQGGVAPHRLDPHQQGAEERGDHERRDQAGARCHRAERSHEGGPKQAPWGANDQASEVNP